MVYGVNFFQEPYEKFMCMKHYTKWWHQVGRYVPKAYPTPEDVVRKARFRTAPLQEPD